MGFILVQFVIYFLLQLYNTLQFSEYYVLAHIICYFMYLFINIREISGTISLFTSYSILIPFKSSLHAIGDFIKFSIYNEGVNGHFNSLWDAVSPILY